MALEYINHTLATPDLPSDPEGVKEVASMFHSAISDLRGAIEVMIAEGDKVATRYALEGTHEGNLFGVSPMGKHLIIKSITVEHVSEDKLREHWRNTVEMGMIRHLGVFGAPAGHAASAGLEVSSW